ACPLLVPLIEGGYGDHETTRAMLREYLLPFEKKPVQSLILGCTHYPLIEREISSRLKNVKVIDSGEAIARQIKKVLQETGLLSQNRTGDVYYTTGDVPVFSKVASKILGQKIKSRQAYS
ncbi:aspartate/glutamate racemase family protein, partial [Candidatus Curtissbacteria bacterium]|nr:aspartate/glutamate racemase family protein [Candidatus Curtissbacteria bacterium]